MAETNKEIAASGRMANGRWARGHPKTSPGRPPGLKNPTTLIAAEVRRRIIESWEDCKGDELLRDLAESDPVQYLKLVTSVLPKDEASGPAVNITLVPGVHEVTRHMDLLHENRQSVLDRLRLAAASTVDATPITLLPDATPATPKNGKRRNGNHP